MDSSNPTEKFLSLQEASKLVSYSAKYLGLRVSQGKLRAIKIGHSWVTKKEWVDEYLTSIEEWKKQKKNHRPQNSQSIQAAIPVRNSRPVSNESSNGAREIIISNGINQILVVILVAVVFFGIGVFVMNYDIPHRFAAMVTETQEGLPTIQDTLHTLRTAMNTAKEQIQKITNSIYSKISGIKTIVKEKTDSNAEKSYEVESRFSGISEPHELSETLHEIKPREASKETIRIREVVEHQEKIIPADVTLVKKEILTDVENINKSLRSQFENALNNLTLKLSRTTVSTDSNTRIITLTQKIDQLSNATFSNATFQGTANQFNLRDTDIPDDITVTGAISPTQLTVSNTITVSGTGTSTYSGGIQAKALNITSTTATSTFSNGIQLGGGALKTVKEIV